jgi:hypothetical protein
LEAAKDAEKRTLKRFPCRAYKTAYKILWFFTGWKKTLFPPAAWHDFCFILAKRPGGAR